MEKNNNEQNKLQFPEHSGFELATLGTAIIVGRKIDITFHCEGKEMLKLQSNGDIYVKKKLVENDKEVVNALREFLLTKK